MRGGVLGEVRSETLVSEVRGEEVWSEKENEGRK